jgi:branched-chain amino acid aminotransferase
MAARAAGFDDVVFKDSGGTLAEGSTKSLFVVRNDKLLLPGLNQVLDGISRRAVLELAQHAGITAEIRPVYWDEVTGADELFVSSTNTVVLGVVQLDDETFDIGPVTSALSQEAQSLLAGTHDLSRRWLTPLSRFG